MARPKKAARPQQAAIVSSQSSESPAKKIRGPRNKENAIVDMLIPYLSDWRGPKVEAEVRAKVHAIIGGKESTVEDYLGRLIDKQRITHHYTANPFMSSFKHQYQQALSFSFAELKKETKKGESWNLHDIVTQLIKEANGWRPEKGTKHFHIIEGIILFGAPFDLLLSIITDNGVDGITQFEQEILSGGKSIPIAISVPITRVSTWPVSFSYRWKAPLETAEP